jgi:enoyl-CoA hydratase/carnithine racemase
VTQKGGLDVTIDDGIAIIVLSQPGRRNAMSLDMWTRLGEQIRRLDQDAGCRVIVIRGAGTSAFSAGADISEFAEIRSTSEKALAYNRRVESSLQAIVQSPKPVIAMIYGFCVGGGCELALACDLRLAADDAVFGIPAARLGISVNHEDLQRLLDLVGPANARLILFSADPRLPARRAFEMGLVTELVPADRLEARVHELAQQIAENSPATIRWVKRAVQDVLCDPSLASFPDRDERAAALFGGEDYQEGVAAFLEKRKPWFRGR